MGIDFTSDNPEDAGPTQLNIGPQPTPQELEQRKSGWRVLLDNLHDPNVRQAVMQTGIGLMRSPQYGQSGWDVGANALQAGVSTLQNLNEHDRQIAEQKAAIARQQGQQAIENNRGDRQVAIGERNANTQEKSIGAQIASEQSAAARGDAALTETTRHNKADEATNAIRAQAERDKAAAAAKGRAGKTSAEIEKINRLKAYYMQQDPTLTPEDADKQAIDYVTNAKGKPPRQLVVEQYQSKVKQWADQQFDPTARPTPEQQAQWVKESIQEIKTLEQAGQDMTDRTGEIKRPPVPTNTPPGGAPVTPATVHPATLRSIEKWKAKGGSPEQIKILIATGGEDPKIYGY